MVIYGHENLIPVCKIAYTLLQTAFLAILPTGIFPKWLCAEIFMILVSLKSFLG